MRKMSYFFIAIFSCSVLIPFCLGRGAGPLTDRCLNQNHTCAKYQDCPHLLYDLSADNDRKTIDAMKRYCGVRKSGKGLTRKLCCSEVNHTYLPQKSADSNLLAVRNCGYSSTNLLNKEAAEYLIKTTPVRVGYCDKWEHVPKRLVPSQEELDKGITLPPYDSIYIPSRHKKDGSSQKRTFRDHLSRMIRSTRKRRMAGGRPSRIGQWPWMARIIFFQSIKAGEAYEGLKLPPRHRCYGVIVNDRWVLTGAECFTSSEILDIYAKIRVGDHDFAETTGQDGLSEVVNWHIFKDIPKPKMIRMLTYIKHPDFKEIGDTGIYQADLCLVKLEYPVSFNDYVNPICLPTSEAPKEATDNSAEFNVAVGGSLNAYLFPIYENQYAYVHLYLPVLEMKHCERAYGTSLSDETLVCAGGKIGQQLCQMDQSSPLMTIVADGRWFLVGLETPYSPEHVREWCDSRDRPTLFTRVSAYMDWIIKTMNEYSDH